MSGKPSISVSGNLYAQTITVSGPIETAEAAKTLGDCEPCKNSHPGQYQAGLPITVGTGNMFERAADYTTTGPNPLSFTRYYNSMQQPFNLMTLAMSLGADWRSNFDRYVNIASATAVGIERPDGQVLNFAASGGVWTSDTDVDLKLTQANGTWTLTDRDDTVETYSAVTAMVGTTAGPYGRLASIQSRNGYN
jgi:hypothetical protein